MYAIYIPMVEREISLLISLINIWKRFEIAPRGILNRTDLIISVDLDVTVSKLSKWLPYFSRLGFNNVEVFSAGLRADESIYIRDNPIDSPVPKYGFKSGPNLQWLATQRYLSGIYSVSLQYELDVFPLCKHWWAKLINLSPRESFVVGPIYRGPTRLGGSIINHINGNALYRTDHLHHARWVDFVESCILRSVSKGRISTAFDIAPFEIMHDFTMPGAVAMFDGNLSSMIKNEDDLRYIIERYIYTNAIANYSGSVELRQEADFEPNMVIREYAPDAVLIHSALFRGYMESIMNRGEKNLDGYFSS